MNEKDRRKEKRQKRGLYFALAVCLVAVAVAGWGTYSGVMDYLSQKNESSDTSEAESSVIKPYSEADKTVNTAPDVAGDEDSSEDVLTEEAPAESSEEGTEDSITESADTESEETVNAPLYTPSEKLTIENAEIIEPYSSEPIFNKTMGDWRSHSGTDIGAKAGETVKAVGNGVVTETGKDLLLGNYIVIEHGEYSVKYCGLGDTLLVSKDQVVNAGDDIGSVTTVPSEAHEASHIHIELKNASGYIDPMKIINAE